MLGLALTHPPEQLNFILVDFKGGATFLGLEHLPHVSAVITNLEGELSLVDRMQDAIGGELDRRMEVLRSAGNFKNREDYENARQAGQNLDPMPSLFIVVDEFSELLSAQPEFIDLFVQIGRVGRSITVHQLLASQRLEENKLRGLDTFLSYRIALRTFSPAESRTVIGVPDAYELPTPPGNGYLKFDTTGMTRFKAAYVSGPWHGSDTSAPTQHSPLDDVVVETKRWTPPVLEFTADYVVPVAPPEPEIDEAAGRHAIVEAAEEKPADREDDEEETLLTHRGGPHEGPWLAGLRCGCRRSTTRRPWTSCLAASSTSRAAASRSPTRRPAGCCGPRSASSTGRDTSVATRGGSTSPVLAATSPSRAVRRPASRWRCERVLPVWH